MKSIHEIVEPEIRLVEDPEIRAVLLETYEECAPALETIQSCWQTITERKWPTVALCQFFKNWRNPAIGAGSFCALTCRLLKEADESQPGSQAQQELFLSAIRIAEVSYEDMGLFTPNHAELYEEMATTFCGNDNWKLQRYTVPEAKQFLDGARVYRERGPDMTRALMISLAEELYNHGEFTYIAPLFKQWHDRHLEMDQGRRKEHLRFVTEHIGGTESGHFANMTQGLVRYARAHGIEPDWTALGERNKEYIQGIRDSFEYLVDAMTQTFNVDSAVSAAQ